MPIFLISFLTLFIIPKGPQSITRVFLVGWEEKGRTFSFDTHATRTYSVQLWEYRK